ncbi:MAG: hypothetical protein MJ138_03680 [Kiritimatiellae bacterium]|nr:hypothetical protein [Kiritimatiellia bacterium]
MKIWRALACLALSAGTALSVSPAGAAEGRWVRDGRLTARRFHPGTEFSYQAWAPDGIKTNAAVYLLLELPVGSTQAKLSELMVSGDVPPGMIVWNVPGNLPMRVKGASARWMRASEYDQPGTEYPNFLVEELVPAAAAALGVETSPSPEMHFITGGSSGGICAWNAAWFRNDFFRRVYLASPTFSAMRGGEEMMTILRKCETRPIRAFVTAGTVEPDSFFGDSLYVALNAVGALAYAGYDHRFNLYDHEGHGTHFSDMKFWGEMMPWMFRGWRTNEAVAVGNPLRVEKLLAPGSVWTECDRKMPPPRREVKSVDGGRMYSVSPDSRFVSADTLDENGGRCGRFVLSTLHVAWNARAVGGRAIALLRDDRVLAATDLGIQGVVSFGLTDVVLPLPGDLPADNVAVAGTTLYASSGERVFKRELAIGAADPTLQVAPSTPGYSDGFNYSREHLHTGGRPTIQ